MCIYIHICTYVNVDVIWYNMFYSAKHVVFTSFNGDRTFEKGKSACLNQVFFTARYDLFNFKKRGRAEYLWSLLNGGMKIHKIKFFFVWLKIRGWITPPKSWSSLGTCSQPGNPEEHIIKYQSDNFQFFFSRSILSWIPKHACLSWSTSPWKPMDGHLRVKVPWWRCNRDVPWMALWIGPWIGPFSRMHPLHFQVKLTNPKFLTSHFMVIWNWLLISQRFPKYISIEYIDCSPMITPVPVCWNF